MKLVLQSLAVAAALLLSWAAFVRVARPNGGLAGQNFLQRNFIRAQEYLYHTPERPIVLAGSSIAERIPADVLGPQFVHLGLVKDNALTGAKIVQSSDVHPRLVLVELGLANLESIGPQLLESLFTPMQRHVWSRFRVFEERYQPATVFLAWLKKALLGKRGANDMAGVNEQVTARWLASTERLFQTTPSLHQSDGYLHALKGVLESLRQSGVAVALFETPMHPLLLNTRRQQFVEQEFNRYFPPDEWPRIRVMRHEDYRTEDGIHLVRSEAASFADYLRREAEAMLGSNSVPGSPSQESRVGGARN